MIKPNNVFVPIVPIAHICSHIYDDGCTTISPKIDNYCIICMPDS